MKRFLAGLMALLLLMGSALAEGFTQNNAAITIDGVRVAFFDAEGNYLQPMEQNGLVWAPLNALCENLGKTAQVQGQSIMVDGVRIGMFDEAGNFLMPQEINGAVYVPLKAFCEAAEISLTQSGDTYAVQRAAAAPVTPEPAPAATAVPFYGYVPLTEANFSDFFNISTSYTESNSDYRTNSFTTTHHLTVQAATSYGLENVVISFAEYGMVAIPASGYAKAQYSDTIYKSSFGTDKSYISGISRKRTENVLLYSYTANYTIKSVSGRLRMSYQEAESLLAGYYQKAGSSGYDKAIGYYELLVQADYKDSREKLKEVKAKKAAADKAEAERKAREKEEANLKKYNEAQVMLDEGRYGEAVEAFMALKDYKDSQSKLAEATEKKNAEDYNKAAAFEAEEKYAEAIEAFKALGDYKDSPQRLIACEKAKQLAQNRAAYARAEALEEAGEYIKAYDAFKALGSFEDSAQRAEAVVDPMTIQEAKNLMEAKQYEKAQGNLLPLRSQYPEAEKLYWQATFRKNGMETPMSSEGVGWVVNGNQRAQMDYQGNVLAVVNHGFIGEWKDGYCQAGNPGVAWYQGGQVYYDAKGQRAFGQEFKKTEDFHQGKALVTKEDGTRAVINTQGEEIKLPEKKGREYVSYVGEDLVCFKEKDKYGLMNLSGKVVVKAKYVKAIGRFQYGLAEVAAGKTSAVKNGLINAKGKEVVKPGKYWQVKALGEDMIAVKATKQSTYWEILNLKGKPYTSGALPQCDEIERYGQLFIIEQRGDKPTLVRGADLKAYQVNGQAVPDADHGIDVGYQGQAFRMWNKDNMSFWIDGEVIFKEAFTSKTRYWKPPMSFDSPYIVWKNDDRGWMILDSEGNITF